MTLKEQKELNAAATKILKIKANNDIDSRYTALIMLTNAVEVARNQKLPKPSLKKCPGML